MPKIIDNLKEKLVSEAERQVREHGYSATTIRSVAAAVGVGVGTVYNYFPSKEMLVASFVFSDWLEYLSRMRTLADDDPLVLFGGIYRGLCGFMTKHEKIFSDEEAARQAAVGISHRHKMLRSQIAELILPLCQRRELDGAEQSADFIAEALISWSAEGTDFEKIYPILERIIKN